MSALALSGHPLVALHMSAFGRKADMAVCAAECTKADMRRSALRFLPYGKFESAT